MRSPSTANRYLAALSGAFTTARGQGIARQLMNYALDFGKKRECQFAFVETMSFQAPEFYQKMGFTIEFSRPGYARDTVFHCLKKDFQ